MIERPRAAAPHRSGGDGLVEVFVSDEQGDVLVDSWRWQQLAMRVLAAEGVKGQAEMALLFVSREAITEMNRVHMGIDDATDVLAFPIDMVDNSRAAGPTARSATPVVARVEGGELPLLVGDVVVCPAVASEQASSHAGNLDDEIALLVTHGILHVLGYDHDDDANAGKMRQRERALLEELHWQAPAPEIFSQGY
ncbi:MAG: rRNA maturation RNase YbeY [Ilumatobacteraceae bacterium]|nr:rRNA maturation RNase YbeY [Ilumatobacteraceae bacterium]